jgi:hypothetical protein
VRSEGDNTTGLWKSRNLQITTDTVCDQCNNVWLSNFENNAVKPLATPLIQGSEDVITMPADQWTLAAWAFKMALLLEIAAKKNPQPFFTAASGNSSERRSSQARRFVSSLRSTSTANIQRVLPFPFHAHTPRRPAAVPLEDFDHHRWLHGDASHVGSFANFR